jgi:hypothetical protein
MLERQNGDERMPAILRSAAFWWIERGNCYRTGAFPDDRCEYYLEHLMNEQK